MKIGYEILFLQATYPQHLGVSGVEPNDITVRIAETTV